MERKKPLAEWGPEGTIDVADGDKMKLAKMMDKAGIKDHKIRTRILALHFAFFPAFFPRRAFACWKKAEKFLYKRLTDEDLKFSKKSPRAFSEDMLDKCYDLSFDYMSDLKEKRRCRASYK